MSTKYSRRQGSTRGWRYQVKQQMHVRTLAAPAQWLYGLYRALPGERIRLVTVAAGLMADRIRLDRFRHRGFVELINERHWRAPCGAA
jgi:hypothetical protein